MNQSKQTPWLIIISLIVMAILIYLGWHITSVAVFGINFAPPNSGNAGEIITASAPSSPILQTQTFSGTWQGNDSYDGSVMTISLVQKGNQLEGTLSDTFTKHPDGTTLSGVAGPGSGEIISATEAEITFDLTRANGDHFQFKARIKLSDPNTLILDDSTILLRQ